jgi:phosphoribosylcarboxyaminoimidazole (NCAIR) mutase
VARHTSRVEIAAHVVLPVLGVPIQSKALRGLDSPFYRANAGRRSRRRPRNWIVRRKNAGLPRLASSRFPTRSQKLEAFRKKQTDAVLAVGGAEVNRNRFLL